jgi:multidrug efflux pump subunit AcrA (membrane-fusion protein)
MLWPFPAIPNSHKNSPKNSHMKYSLIALAIVTASTAAAAEAPSPSFDCVIDPSEVVKLGSPIPGVLAEVLVNRGDAVTRGQPVAALESAIEAATVRLNQFRAESTAKIQAQEERLKLARSRVERYGNPRGLVVTQDKFEEIQAEARVAEQELLREQQDKQNAQL